MNGAKMRSDSDGADERRRAASRFGMVLVPVAVLALLAAFPGAAAACPVCFDRDDEARVAFLATTGLLTLLPLGMVGGVLAWLRKRARSAEEEV